MLPYRECGICREFVATVGGVGVPLRIRPLRLTLMRAFLKRMQEIRETLRWEFDKITLDSEFSYFYGNMPSDAMRKGARAMLGVLPVPNENVLLANSKLLLPASKPNCAMSTFPPPVGPDADVVQ